MDFDLHCLGSYLDARKWEYFVYQDQEINQCRFIELSEVEAGFITPQEHLILQF